MRSETKPFDPLLLDVPEEITTARLKLRSPRVGDGALILPAVQASMPELKHWMPWASDAYGVNDSEAWCRRTAAKCALREEFAFLLFLAAAGEHIGNASLFAFDWKVPRCEIGYWLATSHCGRGLMTEAVAALFAFAVDHLKARRVEIRCDERNERSARVALRCGFELDGVLRHESRGTDGHLRNMRVYSRLSPGS